MATFGSTVRRGLPRVPGGEPWPPAAAIPGQGEVGTGPSAESSAASEPSAQAVVAPRPAAPGEPAGPPSVTQAAPVTPGVRPDAAASSAASLRASADGARVVRRGLPRVAGGEPWPPAREVPVARRATAAPAGAQTVQPAASDSDTPQDATPEIQPKPAGVSQTTGSGGSTPRVVAPGSTAAAPAGAGRALRRGLPRVPGGEPWPPAGLAPTRSDRSAESTAPLETPDRAGSLRGLQEEAPRSPGTAALVADAGTGASEQPFATATGVPLTEPLPFTRTVWAGAAARTRPAPRPEPERVGPFTRLQWAGAAIVAGGGLLVAAAMAVLVVRWLLSTPWGADFLQAFPGEYHLPEGAPVGFPAWLGWQHFFNTFLIVLIIRSGWRVRTEKRPTAFWSPRTNRKRKISLTLWFHQALDVLWVLNGVVFVVLLFVSGQWMRIVPTSWEVFPNALSAALQYVSLDWPTENGWVNYNSLQQLAYFATVFVAAPLAAVTGVRMSGVWPKNAAALNRVYPVEWARAIHFPVMIYFVLFILVHVALVFATGALRNLNHMYAAQDAVNWTGFWIFVASMVVIAAGWVAARPLVLAPIARLFGTVSGR